MQMILPESLNVNKKQILALVQLCFVPEETFDQSKGFAFNHLQQEQKQRELVRGPS
jgi:hypothetical protein